MPNTRHEIAFIDPSVTDIETLLAGIDANVEIVLLDSTRDGVDQIAEALAGRSNIDAIHILSHGNSANLHLGTADLNSATVNSHYADHLRMIGGALSADADILIYGCNFADGADGIELAQRLADLTGADIAASDDLTGHAALGGDWTLEVSSGAIETQVPVARSTQESWQYVLPTVTFQEGTSGYAGTSDTYLDSNGADTSFGASTIIAVDDVTGANEQQILIKFDNIFGNGSGQIPVGATITSASLQFYVSYVEEFVAVELYEMNANWSEASTWNSLSGGVTTDGFEAGFNPISVLSDGGSGSQQFTGLASSVQSWLDGTANNGWLIKTIFPGHTHNWTVYSSENAVAGGRPILSVTYTLPPSPPMTTDLAGDSLAYSEGDGAVVIEQGGDVSVSDIDSANFAGGSLAISFVSGSDSAEDVLAIRNQGTGAGQIGVSGSNVTYGGVTIGSFAGGSSGANLVISFNGNATPAAAEELIRNVTFQDTDTNAPTTGARTVRYVLFDGDGGTSANYDTTVIVSSVNDAPVTSNLAGDNLAYSEGAGAVVIEQGGNATVSDVDSANFAGGSLTVSLTAGSDSAEDILAIRNQGSGAGQIGISGSNVTYGGVTIGSFVGGSSGADLVISFNASATPAAAQALVRNITFEDTDTSTPTTGARTVRYVLTDGDGGTSANYDATVTVSAVADVPVISNLGGDSVAYSEGDGAVVIEQGGNATVSDPDSSDFAGGSLTVSFAAGSDSAEDVLAIRNQGGGAGQIGISGSNVTYGGIVIGSFSGGSSGTNLVVSLNANATPAAVEALIRNISFEDTDTNSPTMGARTVRYVLVDGDGGTSANYDTSVIVSAVNDAPVLDASRSPALLAQNEDAGAPVGPVGTLISSLIDFAVPAGQLDNVTDVDSGAVTGIAVIAADTANGTWLYSIDNGTNWSALGTVTDSNARMLAATAGTRLYFLADANYNGTMPNAILFRAWDRTSGVNGGLADASVNGGTTAFSNVADVAVITVTAVNDAPSLMNGATVSLPETVENVVSSGTTVSSILASTAGSDPDGSTMNGIAITSAIGNGTWQYSTDGASWTNVGNVSATNALLVDSTTRIRYLPSGVAETAKIGFVSWDRTAGTSSTNAIPSYANPGVGGGTSAYSNDSAAATILVRAAPVTGIGLNSGGAGAAPSLNTDLLALDTEEKRTSGAGSARATNPPVVVALASGFVLPAKPTSRENEEESANPLLQPPVASQETNFSLTPNTAAQDIIVEPADKIDLALSDFDKTAFREALNRELDDLKETDAVTHAVLMQVLSGSSVALTAGAVGWMLRGGALASALLSSMPVLRGFDPLMVATRPDKSKMQKPDSLVDRMFEEAIHDKKRTAEGAL